MSLIHGTLPRHMVSIKALSKNNKNDNNHSNDNDDNNDNGTLNEIV